MLQNVPLERLLAETDESPLDIRTVIGQMAEAKDVALSVIRMMEKYTLKNKEINRRKSRSISPVMTKIQ